MSLRRPRPATSIGHRSAFTKTKSHHIPFNRDLLVDGETDSQAETSVKTLTMLTGDTHHHSRTPRRLVLCFDGTAESFEGNAADTNVVKLYSKFDRTNPEQLHYYQPGVGTFPTNAYNESPGFLGKAWNRMVQLFDQGFATSFNSHVMNGYRFIMRYYEEGDKIYIFGFSRGAFIARFLARFVSQVGLLSTGNEQLVPFAYSNFLDYELGTGRKDIEDYLLKFTAAFCRCYNQDRADGLVPGVQIHFLGLFDTVNSVSIFDLPKKTRKPASVHGTAKHIRHAVAVDERRVKFKVALLVQDTVAEDIAKEDIKEVWFPGCHTDIGGGNPPEKKDKKLGCIPTATSTLRTMTGLGRRASRRTAPQRVLQLSDIALKWMIDEIDLLPDDELSWNPQKDQFLEHYRNHIHEALDSRIHDALRGGEENAATYLLWQVLEILPLKRWQFLNGEWLVTRKPNYRRYRDVPPSSVFHRSLVERIEHDGLYHPRNKVWSTDDASFVRLEDVDSGIIQDEDGHPLARKIDDPKKSKKIQEPARARFEMHSRGSEDMGQDEEDNTYEIVNVQVKDRVDEQ